MNYFVMKNTLPRHHHASDVNRMSKRQKQFSRGARVCETLCTASRNNTPEPSIFLMSVLGGDGVIRNPEMMELIQELTTVATETME